MRVGLVGCVKSKQPVPAPAQELYVSTLFHGRRKYVERTCDLWFVLSAKHGLVDPFEVIEPYDVALSKQPVTYREQWSREVIGSLQRKFGQLSGITFELHAGSSYRNSGLKDGLLKLGAIIDNPTEDFRFGEQLAFYGDAANAVGPTNPTGSNGNRSSYKSIGEFLSKVGSDEVTLSFDEIESVIGRRLPKSASKYGVWWANSISNPQSQGWVPFGWKVRRIRVGDRKVNFYRDAMPPSISTIERQEPPMLGNWLQKIGQFLSSSLGSEVTLTFDQIQVIIDRLLPVEATKSSPWWANSISNPQSLGWVPYGWKTHRVYLEVRTVRFIRIDAFVTEETADAPPTTEPWMDLSSDDDSHVELLESDTKAVVEKMLEYGSALSTQRKAEGITYTPDPAANELVISDPFAFLIGVIFDQGITAERAWAAPYELQQRLGHLDPQRLAIDLEGIRNAIQTRPKLHRFVNNLPEWVAFAAEKVVRDYGGDASRIWNDKPTAQILYNRLVSFKGIGQKKAAMTVELLERDFEITITDLEGGDVAFDVHIRRVFLRAGLGDVDRLDDIVRNARRHHPERPGSLDGPAWQIGRRWCRPAFPRCYECVLNSVCPKFIERTGDVKGI